MRLLWREAKSESKRWERDSLTDEYGVRSSRLLSLEQRKTNDQCEESEWLAAPDDQIETLDNMEDIEMKADVSAQKRCYTVEDLQTILCVSRPTVYNLLKKNEFRWFQIGGGKYRIPKKSFDDWLDNQ